MSATQAVKEYMDTFKPTKGMTVEKYARAMFDMQTEIYSAWAGSDLYSSDGQGLYWHNLTNKDKEDWLKCARDQAKKFGMKLPEEVAKHG